MTRARACLFWIYVGLGALALLACWRQNVAFMHAAGTSFTGTFFAFWPALLANHATTSIAIDIFVFALAANVWMVVDAHRHGVRYVWVYILLGPLVAISVVYPWYLAARERHLAATGEPDPRMRAIEAVALAVLAVPAIGLSLWTLVTT
jgi:Gpi18-like mannosyltransferase